ncbi:hypothetical protein FACS189452_08130 [Bacteroidia bacterium]|nr:hypothetical protein FACS189452_08130 [Bacteroidia bacterium]
MESQIINNQDMASDEELKVSENEVVSSEAATSVSQIFADMDCVAMLAKFSELLKTKPAKELRAIAEQLKASFYKKRNLDVEELQKVFVAQGNPADEFVVPDDGLEQKLKEKLLQYRTRHNEYMQKIAAEQDENLRKKQALIEELKQLLERQDDFNVVFNDFKTLQQRWRDIGMTPPAQQNDLWRTYNHNVEKFYDRVKINRELRELDFKKNMELKQLLCEKAEDLLLENNVVLAFRKLQKYHEQWREVGPVSQEQRNAIWERFQEASTQLNKKHNDYFEQQKQEQQNNLALKQTLCEQTESLIDPLPDSIKKWNAQMEQLLEMQRMWKTVGAAPRKEHERIYQRFRTACNAFFDARKNFFSEAKEEYTENLQKKTALCEQAEALSHSEDWNNATRELVLLQAKWKTIGAVSRKHSDDVWNRFRVACNTFFERKKEHFATQETVYDENLKAKETLIVEMKNYTASDNPQANLDAIKQWQQRWTEIGFVPRKDTERIQTAYREALSEIYKSLNISDSQIRLQKFKLQAEQYATQDPQRKKEQKDRLTRQIQRLEDEKRLWENNVNFFAKSKNAEQLIADIHSKIEKHEQEIAIIKEELKLLK